VSILGLTTDELASLRTFLLAAIESPCIPEWEFDSLVGCSRAEALSLVESGLEHAHHEPGTLDRVITLLSILAGFAHLSAPPQSRDDATLTAGSQQLDQLLEKLFWADGEHTLRQSSVTLRPAARASEPARKRRA
jgi:hypothetical protein